MFFPIFKIKISHLHGIFVGFKEKTKALVTITLRSLAGLMVWLACARSVVFAFASTAPVFSFHGGHAYGLR